MNSDGLCKSTSQLHGGKPLNQQIDFSHITPCGECCDGCRKRAEGLCRGCLETDGHCEEWANSGVCPTFACCKEHGIPFCGLCPEFPCDHLPMLKWRPDCVKELTALADTYRRHCDN